MSLSIVMPVYNAAASLVAAIASIQSQTFTEWELWLIDDGSTDDSSDLANDLAGEDSRIRVVQRPHEGIVSALNHGLQLSQGDYTARMDADDVCYPTRFQKQIDYLKQNPDLGVVSCQVEFGGDSHKQKGYAAHVDWINSTLRPEEHYANRFVDAPVAHPSVMWRRELPEKFGSYREGHFPEDFELWLRWMEQGLRFAKIAEPLMIWNDFPERLSRKDDRYGIDAFYEIKCQYLKQTLPKDRPVWLWGAGRISRKRFRGLKSLAGYVDVDSRKIGQKVEGLPVRSYHELPANAFVLSGVANRGVRNEIEAYLRSTGRQPVRDYYLCA